MIKVEGEVGKLLKKALYNKSTKVSPVKWGMKDNTVVLVYWKDYTVNKKTVEMFEKLKAKLEALNLQVEALEDCDVTLEWHYI